MSRNEALQASGESCNEEQPQRSSLEELQRSSIEMPRRGASQRVELRRWVPKRSGKGRSGVSSKEAPQASGESCNEEQPQRSSLEELQRSSIEAPQRVALWRRREDGF